MPNEPRKADYELARDILGFYADPRDVQRAARRIAAYREKCVAAPREIDAEEFGFLVEKWIKETRGVSSFSDVVMHESHQRILASGTKALPFIFKDFRDNPRFWFYALCKIVGDDIAAKAGARTYASAREAWIKWGYDNNHIIVAGNLVAVGVSPRCKDRTENTCN